EQWVEKLLLYIRFVRKIVRRNGKEVHKTAHSDSAHKEKNITIAGRLRPACFSSGTDRHRSKSTPVGNTASNTVDSCRNERQARNSVPRWRHSRREALLLRQP